MTSILVVDDDFAVRDALTMLLEDAGHAVSTAADGAAALEIIARERPDLVITDLYMPCLNGAELIARLQREQPSLPILIVSAGIRMTPPSGLPVIFKPFDVEQLLTTVALLVSLDGHEPDSVDDTGVPRWIA